MNLISTLKTVADGVLDFIVGGAIIGTLLAVFVALLILVVMNPAKSLLVVAAGIFICASIAFGHDIRTGNLP